MMAIVELTEVSGGALADAHRAHYRSLVRLASLLIDDVGTCEEVVQDAFVRVFARPRRLVGATKVAAYLRSAVLNGARSHLRGRVVRQRPGTLHIIALDAAGGDVDPTGTDALEHDEHAMVLDALRSLPDRQRDVLVLRYWGGLTETEIAATLGVAGGTVKTHAARGLAALAKMLEATR